jgi:hypothetical protein
MVLQPRPFPPSGRGCAIPTSRRSLQRPPTRGATVEAVDPGLRHDSPPWLRFTPGVAAPVVYPRERPGPRPARTQLLPSAVLPLGGAPKLHPPGRYQLACLNLFRIRTSDRRRIGRGQETPISVRLSNFGGLAFVVLVVRVLRPWGRERFASGPGRVLTSSRRKCGRLMSTGWSTSAISRRDRRAGSGR